MKNFQVSNSMVAKEALLGLNLVNQLDIDKVVSAGFTDC